MPDMPPPFRGSRGTPVERRRVYDAERRANNPARGWYKTAAWRKRREDQLQREPLCRRCDMQGIVTAATVANHVKPHRGNWDLFINGELESTCKPCHDSVIQREERQNDNREG